MFYGNPKVAIRNCCKTNVLVDCYRYSIIMHRSLLRHYLQLLNQTGCISNTWICINEAFCYPFPLTSDWDDSFKFYLVITRSESCNCQIKFKDLKIMKKDLIITKYFLVIMRKYLVNMGYFLLITRSCWQFFFLFSECNALPQEIEREYFSNEV